MHFPAFEFLLVSFTFPLHHTSLNPTTNISINRPYPLVSLSLNTMSLDAIPLDQEELTVGSDESSINPNAPAVDTEELLVNPNRLNALPVELFRMVCEWLGTLADVRDRKLLSLRLTCKDSYLKSVFNMEETSFRINPSSLAVLLSLSSKPRFSKQMQIIHLRPFRPSTLPRGIDDYNEFLCYEEEYKFITTGEATLILAQCLRNLRNISSLQLLKHCCESPNDMDQMTMLRALQLSQFPRRVAHVVFEIGDGEEPSWGGLEDPLSEFQPYIESAQICAPTLYGGIPPPDEIGQRKLRYQLDNLDLRKRQIAAATNSIKILEITSDEGQLFLPPNFRFVCRFYRYIAAMHYPHIVEFRIDDLLVNGRALCSFFNNNHATLSLFLAGSTTLSSGSWKDVFRGLWELPHIVHFGLCWLHQKGWSNEVVERPPSYRETRGCSPGLEVCTDNARLILDKMITYFQLERSPDSIQEYSRVVLFEVPHLAPNIFPSYSHWQRYMGPARPEYD